MTMKVEEVALWLVLVGALVHLIMGLGQMALISFLNPILGLIQIIVGVAGGWLIAKKLKWIK